MFYPVMDLRGLAVIDPPAIPESRREALRVTLPSDDFGEVVGGQFRKVPGRPVDRRPEPQEDQVAGRRDPADPQRLGEPDELRMVPQVRVDEYFHVRASFFVPRPPRPS
jgi:hypothetical protein